MYVFTEVNREMLEMQVIPLLDKLYNHVGYTLLIYYTSVMFALETCRSLVVCLKLNIG